MNFNNRIPQRARRRSAWNTVLLLTLASSAIGCTTIRGVGGGSQPGEFYVVTTKSYLIFDSRPIVLRCESDAAKGPACERVLTSKQADAYRLGAYDLSDVEGSDEGSAAPAPVPADWNCWRKGNVAALNGREKGVDAAIAEMGIAADQEQACRAAYEAGYKAGNW